MKDLVQAAEGDMSSGDRACWSETWAAWLVEALQTIGMLKAQVKRLQDELNELEDAVGFGYE